MAGTVPQRVLPVYDTWPYELQPPLGPCPWLVGDVAAEMQKRVAEAKNAGELRVEYYRIGDTIAYALPVNERPAWLPTQIPGLRSAYPWLIWLAWALEERWRLLHAAWRREGDAGAGALFQKELAALAGWSHFREYGDHIHLVTAHLAGMLALGVADPAGWDQHCYQSASTAARSMFENELWPWCQQTWQTEQRFTPRQIHNIPFIILCRAAHLAAALGDQRAGALQEVASKALSTWCQYRLGAEHHTEGTAYDGYLMDSATEWLDTFPGGQAVKESARAAFATLCDQWMDLTLPGRCDIHAPIGDVEPEMTFWASALMRMARWYRWPEAFWLLRQVPLPRLPAAALVTALDIDWQCSASNPEAPAAGPAEHAGAVTLRSGRTGEDGLVAVGASRNCLGHLHNDGGSLVVGWQGRFWITDPGYQQYRSGDERDYTLGAEAHNCPVIDGKPQRRQAMQLLQLGQDEHGWQRVDMDLTRCYEALPAEGSVRRSIWLCSAANHVIAVKDEWRGLPPQVEVGVHWQGGAQLAWSYVQGWIRLSDGARALWIGTHPHGFGADQFSRHAGTRGPLTLHHTTRSEPGQGNIWWFFCCDPEGNWHPPILKAEQQRLVLIHNGNPVAFDVDS